MFALLALVLAVLAGFNVTFDSVSSFDLLAFALAALAAHALWPVYLRR
ncbi:MAG: hypothetical protein ACXVYY_01275 [Oryzihumus sp.]